MTALFREVSFSCWLAALLLCFFSVISALFSMALFPFSLYPMFFLVRWKLPLFPSYSLPLFLSWFLFFFLHLGFLDLVLPCISLSLINGSCLCCHQSDVVKSIKLERRTSLETDLRPSTADVPSRTTTSARLARTQSLFSARQPSAPANSPLSSVSTFIRRSPPPIPALTVPHTERNRETTVEPMLLAPSTTQVSSMASGDHVVIKVCDEARQITKDFVCQQDLLLREMRYFHGDMTEDDSTTRMASDITVHCDITIFNWLMSYIQVS